jgi:hypothetical protein
MPNDAHEKGNQQSKEADRKPVCSAQPKVESISNLGQETEKAENRDNGGWLSP